MNSIERLGSALLHFLWQGVLIAALYAAARRFAARSSPNVRYLLACAALLLMAAAPVITWSLLSPPAPASVAATFAAPLSADSAAVHHASRSVPAAPDPAAPAPFLPWVVAVWLAGAAACSGRLLCGWIFAQRLRSRSVCPAPDPWRHTLHRLRSRIRLGRPVRLLVSSVVHAPAVVGWLRPVLLVPAGALAGLPPEQVEALLLHELAHIRRHDYLVNGLQSIVEALLFYHPAVWWVSGHIRAEREHCCDDAAVSATGDVLMYARALAGLESARQTRWSAAMASTGGSLADRIARLLGYPRPGSRTVSSPGIFAAAILLAVAAIALWGQPAERLKFEVASVKPSTQRNFQMVRPQPGRLTANASLRMLMQNAYAVQAFQLSGGPPWIDSERYEIEATAAGQATRAQIFLMLQSLLEDRFQLKIHRETREFPVYALVPGRGGLKLPPPKEGSCVAPPPDALPEWAGGRMPPPVPGRPPSPRCGTLALMLESSGARMQGGQIPMPELVRNLSMILGRSVIDRTGFTGLFDVVLDFIPDEATPLMPPPPPGSAAARDLNNPTILTALQEQLGLRLDGTRGPVEVIVIDHIERPSAN